MEGGSIIGQGQYGCVVRPPFLCRGQAANERNSSVAAARIHVGKITQIVDAETELHIAKTLQKISQWRSYFILPTEVCRPKMATRVTDWSGCQITGTEPRSALTQVISDFQGHKTLSQTDIRPSHFDFFYFFKHMLEAVALMNLRGVVHYDIHGANILFDSHGVPRLLDFGLSFHATEIAVDTMWKVYDPKYNQEPPEVSVATGIQDNRGEQTALKETIQQKPVFKNMTRMFGTDFTQYEEELRLFFSRSTSARARDWTAFFKLYWPGFDSFALAAIYLEILTICIQWPSFINKHEWKENETRILTVIQKMLNPVPSERYDCIEALAFYDPQNAVLHANNAHVKKWLSVREKHHAPLSS